MKNNQLINPVAPFSDIALQNFVGVLATAQAQSGKLIEDNAISSIASIQLNPATGKSLNISLNSLFYGGWTRIDNTSLYTRNGTYGTATLDITTGKINYVLDNTLYATNGLYGGQIVKDTFFIPDTVNGVVSLATVNFSITGTNDVAIISGQSEGHLIETNAIQSVSGKLDVTDVDGSSTFVAQTNVLGSGKYGKFTIDATGAWTYSMTTAHDEFVGGATYKDSITVKTADGTSKVIKVDILGTEDKVVISGVSTANLTETNSILNASGTLNASEGGVVGTFVERLNVEGSNGYGIFNFTADGKWTYKAYTAHNEFKDGVTYTDSFIVSTLDGTKQEVKVAITGTNDAALINGITSVNGYQGKVALTTMGVLTISDEDSTAAFEELNNINGDNGFGSFSLTADGKWTYTMNGPHLEFKVGSVNRDSFTATSLDGTTKVVTVTIYGTDDKPIITGQSTATILETDEAEIVSGVLTLEDPDGGALTQFNAIDGILGTKGYGRFNIDADGNWEYVMETAHDEFKEGQTYIDSTTVTTTDGQSKVITVTIIGKDDIPVISLVEPQEPIAIFESDIAQTISGKFEITDVDASEPPKLQEINNLPGVYGKFTVHSSGEWTYGMDSAHDEFKEGETYTDTIIVNSADGKNSYDLTITIEGTNDSAIIKGDIELNLVESNNVLTASGQLTSKDVDGNDNVFIADSIFGKYGSLIIDENGAWVYETDGSPDQLKGGVSYLDVINVSAEDGTTQNITITITGTDDAPIIFGYDPENLIVLQETNQTQNISGKLTITDIDTDILPSFVVENKLEKYGFFNIDSNGNWSYTMDGANNELKEGETYSDEYTFITTSGETQKVTIYIEGTNDEAVFKGTSTLKLYETNAIQKASGQLNVLDVDGLSEFVAQENAVGSEGLGTFTIDAHGIWTYVMDSAHNEFVAGKVYKDTLTVQSDDGTEKDLTVSIIGTNDAAKIIGVNSAEIIQSNVAETVGDSLSAVDADDGQSLFIPFAEVLGKYGNFSIDADGAWTYTMNGAHKEFLDGVIYIDSAPIPATSLDKTAKQFVSVNIIGSEDPSELSVGSVKLIESDTNLTTLGQLTIKDVDSATKFAAGSFAGDFGSLVLSEDGQWTYATYDSNDQMVVGEVYQDIFEVYSVDGTSTTVTIDITGTNDAAELSIGTASLKETNEVLTVSDQLTISDVDSPESFLAQSIKGQWGSLMINEVGEWTYQAQANNQMVGGQVYNEIFTVKAFDGTPTSVMVAITGTNDAAIITNPTVTIMDGASHVSGYLTITDVDSAETFMSSTLKGQYGQFAIDANGAWTYTENSTASFVSGKTYHEIFTVHSADGTPATVSINIIGQLGKIIGQDSVTLSEDAIENVSGILSIMNSDAGQALFQPVNSPILSSKGYGTFQVSNDGQWTYDLDTNNKAVNELRQGENLIDTFEVLSIDGASKIVTVNINGVTDALTSVVEDGVNTAQIDVASISSTKYQSITPFSGANFQNLTNSLLSSGDSGLVIDSTSIHLQSSANIYGSSVNYFNGLEALGMSSGVLLTSGGTPGLVNTSSAFGISNSLPGDADINKAISEISGVTSHDATVLEFNCKPTNPLATSVTFEVVFGSDEYPEWAGSFIDCAVVMVNGVNYALFDKNNPNSLLSVTTSNVANGYFQNNLNSVLPVEYDGVSKVLKITAPINSSENNHIKIAVADIGDGSWDSGLFIGNLHADIGGVSTNSENPFYLGINFDVIYPDSVLTSDGWMKVASNLFTKDGEYGVVTFNRANGTATYKLDNDNFATDALSAGDLVDEVFGLRSSENQSVNLVFHVVGSNDAPVVTGTVEASAQEDGDSVTISALDNVYDVDGSAVVSVATVSNLPAGVIYNSQEQTFILDPTVSAYDSLGKGVKQDVVVNYSVTDGTATVAASATFTINGTNDTPLIGAPTVSIVTEDANAVSGNLMASGTISVNDADQNQSSFNTTTTSAAGNLSLIHI